MLLVERVDVFNWENAIRGARNPMNSWARMDSHYDADGHFTLGENDYSLAVRLAKAGSDHRKYLRQVMVSMDITAPLYWWKEFDTYKVGTVANSCSTMHKIHAEPFTRENFACDRLTPDAMAHLDALIAYLESERLAYLETKDIAHWHNMIQLLPTSYLQMRTVSLNYEVLLHMYHARKAHKLHEWHVLCDAIAALPYAKELILLED